MFVRSRTRPALQFTRPIALVTDAWAAGHGVRPEGIRLDGNSPAAIASASPGFSPPPVIGLTMPYLDSGFEELARLQADKQERQVSFELYHSGLLIVGEHEIRYLELH